STGSGGSFSNAKAAWNFTSAGFRNFASATGLSSAATIAAQDASANRALGVRQTGTLEIGGDPGAAFIFLLENTTGRNNLKIDFNLQSLDAGSARVTTWSVDYALGDNPASFTATTATGSLTTGGSTWSNQVVSVNLPAALNNQNQKVWVRIVALTPTTGGGSRASTAIDDVKFSWN
nr:nuclease [Flavisolibacter sp.]